MSKVKIKTTGDVKVTIGPTQPVPFPSPYAAESGNPPNPSAKLYSGAIPTKAPQDQVQRRPFSIPYRPTLHRSSGLSNDEFNQPRHEEQVGQDANKYSKNENKPDTENGVPIYGS